VLLTSGYVGEGPALITDEFPLLDKPYELHALAARLRKLLDPPRGRKRRGRAGGAAQADEPAEASPAAAE